jgi:hypothetical protein
MDYKTKIWFCDRKQKTSIHLGPVDVEEWLAQHAEYGTEARQ